MTTTASIVEKHSFILTWDFDIDTNDTTTNLKLPLKTRFGDVVLEVTVKAPQHINPVLWAGAVEPGSIGHSFNPSAEVLWIHDAGKPKLVQSGSWNLQSDFPPRLPAPIGLHLSSCTAAFFQKAEIADARFNRLTHRRFRVVFTLPDVSPPAATVHPLPRKEVRDNSSYPPRFRRLRGERSPKSETAKTRGWSGRASVLNDASVSVQAGTSAALGMEENGKSSDGDDSDEESDDFIKRRSPPSVEDDSDDGDFTYREINITETAYTTYHAVLLYLQSGYITFAPLASNLLPHKSDAKQTREQLLDQHLSSTPSLPFPVSPKSVYRLAHLLEIPSLCALSLAELKSQLTISNAVRELFSKTSSLYDDLRAVVLAFVVTNWPEVKTSEGMKEMETMARTGQIPHGTATSFELISHISK
ncbi:hypothetical protein BCR35DRAFT_354603 [Leucosporidium creatinivorum]|uniref:BTB domain-containing protein n=1 Tax=Leucosporidium creatinivorum TaxID=106004 RepID=A0A1Y2ECZ3_9BASI|nr:hypothetical protein BCR35DRAFT_354603 [Leucosporidium creatinivorum]